MQHHLPPQVCLVHRLLRLSSCHIYASRLLGAVRCPQGYHPHRVRFLSPLLLSLSSHFPSFAKPVLGFGIIAAFIAYYVGISELLASEVLCSQSAHTSTLIPLYLIRCTFSQHQIPQPITTCRPFYMSSIPIIVSGNYDPCYDYNTIIWCPQIL
ncbi:hypothetical protein ARMGADRAFT_158595 [Armillaria gallica]|uniref:Uncharacterized protein n=1 Tax=Armillaria gallica TaxID=47427 RepID=A0A2H3C897_ARMGA|nr:hypothetical protein ARMGADRAFT_176117 [Armillaria gallica]PBK79295.1 hypothetical protein ARMGADRAFT_158595 [Armillaria gallica]